MARKADESGDRQFVRRVLIVLGLCALFILAWQLRTLLLMFFGAIVVASVFRAFGDRLEKVIGCRNGIAGTRDWGVGGTRSLKGIRRRRSVCCGCGCDGGKRLSGVGNGGFWRGLLAAEDLLDGNGEFLNPGGGDEYLVSVLANNRPGEAIAVFQVEDNRLSANMA